MVLRFNFSMVNDAPETLEREFDTYCLAEIQDMLERYPDLLPDVAAGAGVSGRGDRAADGDPRLHRRGEGAAGVPGRLSERDRLQCVPEAESGKGHADISLEPLLARFPHLRHGCLIALKYLRRREPAEEAGVAAAAGEATSQLRRYLRTSGWRGSIRGCGSRDWR